MVHTTQGDFCHVKLKLQIPPVVTGSYSLTCPPTPTMHPEIEAHAQRDREQ
jgi:hypothetical protein